MYKKSSEDTSLFTVNQSTHGSIDHRLGQSAHGSIDHRLGLDFLHHLSDLGLEIKRLNSVSNTKEKRGYAIIVLKIRDCEYAISVLIVVV